MSDFKNLRVWNAAQTLALDAHRIAASLHGPGTTTLRDQMMRAAMSIPTNIVEGNAHTSPREFIRFLGYALASSSEVEGHTRLARSLDMISERDCACLLDGVEAVRMMLHGPSLHQTRVCGQPENVRLPRSGRARSDRKCRLNTTGLATS